MVYNMKPIPPDFQPNERSINNLKKWISLDIREIRDFVKWELPHMITYFTETKGKKRSWQMTFQRWMRTAWTGKAGRDWEYNRHKYNTQYNNFLHTPAKTITTTTDSKPIWVSITPQQSIANFHRQEDKFNLK